MPRTQYTAADLERLSCNVKDVETVITFRNEQLLNLFINEMQGQISDGMWENSRHTDWLWKNVLYRLGNETKVEVFCSWNIGKKSYPLVKELWEVIEYRLYGAGDETGAGYQTAQEVRSAWRELNLAIYNAAELPRDSQLRVEKQTAYQNHRNTVNNLEERAKTERKSVLKDTYGVYLDAENRKGYVTVDIKVVPSKGTYYFIINKVFKVQEGHLAEGVEAIRNLFMNPGAFELLSTY